MKRTPRVLLILVLFAALIVALLWFQGILFRHEPRLAEVPRPPALPRDARVVEVERRTLERVQRHPGFVAAADAADLAARVLANVRELAVREGDAVEAGAVVVELDDQDARARVAQARAAVDSAQAVAEEARLAFARAERLHDAEAITTADWEAARARRDGAEAAVTRATEALAEAEAALAWYRVRAPFAGRVLARHADPGQLAVPGRPLLTLHREEDLRFEVAVPEEQAASRTVGERFAVHFDGDEDAREAVLVRVLPAADPRSGTVMLHLAPARLAGLRPGALGRLLLPTGTREALLVPIEAIERIGQIERVRLVRDGRVIPVPVRTGKRHGEMVEILAGLRVGEEVLLP